AAPPQGARDQEESRCDDRRAPQSTEAKRSLFPVASGSTGRFKTHASRLRLHPAPFLLLAARENTGTRFSRAWPARPFSPGVDREDVRLPKGIRRRRRGRLFAFGFVLLHLACRQDRQRELHLPVN